jgi:hypothetical protein
MSKTVYILISIVIIFLIAIAIYTSYIPNSEKQKTITENTETSVAITSLSETTPVNTAIETLPTPIETTIAETIETITEDINKNLPTLKLVVYEGPVIVDSDMCTPSVLNAQPTLHNGHYYYKYSDALSWTDAKGPRKNFIV